MNTTLQTPEFRKTFDQKRIFVEDKRNEGKKIPVMIINNTLTITTAFGDKVIFWKSNRGTNFHDSRQKKPITPSEFKSEVRRMLDDDKTAFNAIYQMTGEWE